MILKDIFSVYLLFLFIMNAIAIFAYYADKKKAEKKKWRTPEKVLLGINLLGGCYTGYIKNG